MIEFILGLIIGCFIGAGMLTYCIASYYRVLVL